MCLGVGSRYGSLEMAALGWLPVFRSLFFLFLKKLERKVYWKVAEKGERTP